MTNPRSQRRRAARHDTLLLPLNLPGLRDKTAVQLIDMLYALVGTIELHYATQIDRYHEQQRQLRLSDYRPSTSDDRPF